MDPVHAIPAHGTGVQPGPRARNPRTRYRGAARTPCTQSPHTVQGCSQDPVHAIPAHGTGVQPGPRARNPRTRYRGAARTPCTQSPHTVQGCSQDPVHAIPAHGTGVQPGPRARNPRTRYRGAVRTPCTQSPHTVQGCSQDPVHAIPAHGTGVQSGPRARNPHTRYRGVVRTPCTQSPHTVQGCSRDVHAIPFRVTLTPSAGGSNRPGDTAVPYQFSWNAIRLLQWGSWRSAPVCGDCMHKAPTAPVWRQKGIVCTGPNCTRVASEGDRVHRPQLHPCGVRRGSCAQAPTAPVWCQGPENQGNRHLVLTVTIHTM